jgi:hypothetical protein
MVEKTNNDLQNTTQNKSHCHLFTCKITVVLQALQKVNDTVLATESPRYCSNTSSSSTAEYGGVKILSFRPFDLVNVLSVLLRIRDSDYPFGISKLFLSQEKKKEGTVLEYLALHRTTNDHS